MSFLHPKSKFLMVAALGVFMVGCSTQPDWLTRDRQYEIRDEDGKREVHTQHQSREVAQYDFAWTLTGDVQALPIQVFTVTDEIWLELPQLEGGVEPLIMGYRANHKEGEILPIHRQGAYKVVRKQGWTQLSIVLPNGQTAWATHSSHHPDEDFSVRE